MASKLNITQQVIVILLVFFAVALSRLYYVNTFAVALPFWDQWDAEGGSLLRLWATGQLKFSDLLTNHNEHRIFPTRLLSLLIYEITGEWNNLTEARCNILLAAVIPVILVWVLLKNGGLYGMRWLILPVILAQFAFPFSFENLLIGFQSQFYFMLFFALTSLVLVTYLPQKRYASIAVLILCILSIITMGSGFLTPLAVIGVFVLNLYISSQLSMRNIMMIFALILMVISGYLLVPKIPIHQVFRAQNVNSFVNSLGYILSWPVVKSQFASFLLWIPAMVMIPLLTFRKNMSRTDLLMAGCFIWSFLQAGAIAYGRGQGLTIVSSRYAELFSLGLISNAWFAVRFIEQFQRFQVRWISLTFFCFFFYGHMERFGPDMHEIRLNHNYSVLQTRNVCMYLKTGDKSYLQKSGHEIPFPDPVRLQLYLDNPTIRKMLPEPMKTFVRR